MLRTRGDLTYREIGERLGISPQRAHQITKRALEKIQEALGIREPRPDRRKVLPVIPQTLIEVGEYKNSTIEAIIKKVASAYGFSSGEIHLRRRTKDLAFARHVIMYKLRTKCGLSFPQIGKILGRHHTTVMHGYNRIKHSRLFD